MEVSGHIHGEGVTGGKRTCYETGPVSKLSINHVWKIHGPREDPRPLCRRGQEFLERIPFVCYVTMDSCVPNNPPHTRHPPRPTRPSHFGRRPLTFSVTSLGTPDTPFYTVRLLCRPRVFFPVIPTPSHSLVSPHSPLPRPSTAPRPVQPGRSVRYS